LPRGLPKGLKQTDNLQIQLRQLLRQTLGSTVDLVDFTITHRLHDYFVLLVRLSHPAMQVVVKLAGREAPLACPFDRTAALHGLVAAQTSIPMPEVFAVDVSYKSFPWRYLLKRYIPGQEWAQVRGQMNKEELANAYRQIGGAVAQLHAIRFPAFGELAADGTIQSGAPCLTALVERARCFIKSERSRDLFLSVLDKNAGLFADVRSARLCHEDLHRHNILFHYQEGQWRLATILDFDKAWAGHAESDLARLDLWRGMMGRGFWEAYEKVHPRDVLYQWRRPIYQLLWCLEYARPTAQHLADTQHVCAELGLASIEQF
jgi:aminoglycoside phosphotransferase (APT) family kinase protein